jgi:hypothetical protein
MQIHNKNCKRCAQPFQSKYVQRLYCSQCLGESGPFVYRFICPDGRSYVGAVQYGLGRFVYGVNRSNKRLEKAFKKYPPDTWPHEILERFAAGCSYRDLRLAEQRHVDRLRTCEKRYGFNVHPPIRELGGQHTPETRTALNARLASKTEAA